MSDSPNTRDLLIPHRQVLCYDESIGHRFVPNLKARMRYQNDGYFIVTDDDGFRNGSLETQHPRSGEVGIVALGDSFTAGDGVSNEHRFTDLVAEMMDVQVTNLALPGTGVDQQLLSYEKFGLKNDHEVVLVCPYLADMSRNMVPGRQGMDRSTGDLINIPKPYFTLTKGQLELHNVPVPKERNIPVKSDDYSRETVEGPSTSLRQKLKKDLPDAILDPLKKIRSAKRKFEAFTSYQVLSKQTIKEYDSEDSEEWLLMRALLEETIKKAGNRKVILMPIPLKSHILHQEKPLYIDRFKELALNSDVVLVDIVDELKQQAKEGVELFLPCDHFSKDGHQAVAKVIAEKMLQLSFAKKRVETSKKIENKGNYLLGISCFYHDSAAAIIRDGKIIAAAQEERFSRIKHDPSFPTNAINYCLEEASLNIDDVNGICYYDNTGKTLERVLANSLALGTKADNFWEAASASLSDKINIPRAIRENLNYKNKIYQTDHHRSHAASAFYPSPFSEAAILTVDGVGEWATSTIASADKEGIKILCEMNYPHSLGLLYSAFTWFCGFKVNSGEYKLMGLAPYGKPIYVEKILDHIVDCHDDGSINLNMDYFEFMEGKSMTSNKFDDLFGGPRRKSESRITKREMNLAASIQKVTEEILLKMVNHAHQLTGKKHLVLAGGVALNCVANGKILRDGPFDDVWIQPAAGDAGCALGAALDLHYSGSETKAKDITVQTHTYYGPGYSNQEIENFLETKSLPYQKLDPKTRAHVIAEKLAAGKIVGHFCGRMEFGPRALGNRSILADPRDIETQSILNIKIKYRESFRPFAPMVLEEKISDIFEIDRPSPYMLLVANVVKKLQYETDAVADDNDMLEIIKQARSTLPAITHVDYSARIQSISQAENQKVHDIMTNFQQLTDCPVLVNTSFNVRGEPIVCTPDDAFRCFMRTEMDILVLEDFLLIKEDQEEWGEAKEIWEQIYELD